MQFLRGHIKSVISTPLSSPKATAIIKTLLSSRFQALTLVNFSTSNSCHWLSQFFMSALFTTKQTGCSFVWYSE